MQPETAKQWLNGIGVSRENAEYIAPLPADSRKDEAKQRLRILRCELMDALLACRRIAGQLNWLIRETEKRSLAK